MSFVCSGIEDVRVFILPEGVVTDGRSAAVSRSALVTWRSSNAGLLHHVYVNARFAGATIDAEERCLPVQLPGSFLSATRVTVIAVDSRDAHVDVANELEQAQAVGDRIRLTLLRSQTLPLGAMINIYFDGGAGEIDYTVPLNGSPIPVWPCVQDKAGFGTACFGASDFGYDSAAAVGFAKGLFGSGEFGLDADAIEWIGPPLPAGQHRFGVKVADESGAESLASEVGPIAVAPAATPAAKLNLVTFDPDDNELTFCATP
jgi:hypothetical protein